MDRTSHGAHHSAAVWVVVTPPTLALHRKSLMRLNLELPLESVYVYAHSHSQHEPLNAGPTLIVPTGVGRPPLQRTSANLTQ